LVLFTRIVRNINVLYYRNQFDVFYLVFSGLLTIFFGKLEKKLDYFRG